MLTWQCLLYRLGICKPKYLHVSQYPTIAQPSCVFQAAFCAPESVLQSTKKLCPRYSDQYLESSSICKIRESTGLLLSLAVRNKICKCGLSPVECKQLGQAHMPLNPSLHPCTTSLSERMFTNLKQQRV